MFKIYRWLYNQFGFSRAQSNGFLILLPLTIGIVLSAPVYEACLNPSIGEPPDSGKLDSLVALFNSHKVKSQANNDTVFFFDPNRTPPALLEKLGFPGNIAIRIQRYVENGGRFRKKEDLLRIHGLDSALYLRLYSYIRLEDKQAAQARIFPKTRSDSKRQISRFDLNVADTAQLKLIRGIGSKLSTRIVKYRDVLGGFWNVDQLYEVYALDSAVVRELQKWCFVAPGYVPRKINVNKADRQEIANHPYFTHRQAGSIVAYRFAHGNFHGIEDLRKIGGIDSLTFRKAAPYLTLDQEESRFDKN